VTAPPSVHHQTRTRSELATQPYVGVTVRFRRAAVERLDEITGVGRTPAQTIIAEIGTDMARFPTPGHLASWARYAPGVKQSAGKAKGKATTRHGNAWQPVSSPGCWARPPRPPGGATPSWGSAIGRVLPPAR
jgi:hypothetical protein